MKFLAVLIALTVFYSCGKTHIEIVEKIVNETDTIMVVDTLIVIDTIYTHTNIMELK